MYDLIHGIFCPNCGHRMELMPVGTGWQWVCPHCKSNLYTTSNHTIEMEGAHENQSTHL